MNSKLRGGGLRGSRADSSFNPMEGAANLADVMLVLACGLMLSLIVSWNVDIGGNESLVGVEQGQELTALEGMEESSDINHAGGAGYEEMGKVYRDPKTGKLYMIINEGGE